MASTLNKRVQSSRDSNGVPFRTTRDGVVPQSIGDLHRLTLDPAMKAALTHAGSKLVVEIDAAGTRVLLADSRTNQLIGGPEDLQKLGTIQAFVNRERKDATAIESVKEATQLTFLATNVVKLTQPDFQMRPVDSSYTAALRPLQSALEQCIENEKRISENTSQECRETFELQLKRLFHATQNAYVDTIAVLVKGESIKGVLGRNLFARGVPEWVHSRIVTKNWNLGHTEELSKFFFPNDPIKGLALSVKEWRDDDFVAKQGQLVAASQLLYTLLNDDELLRSMLGLDESVSLEDEENPVISKMLKTKAVVMPRRSTPAKVIELGSKVRSGFKFPNPGMDTATGAIVALSTAVLRLYAANLQSVDLVDEYYSTIVPGAVRREDVTPTNNFYVQWGNAPEPGRVWREVIRGAPDDLNLRQKLWRWLRTELRFSEKAKAGKALADALGLNEDGSAVTEHPALTDGKIDLAAEGIAHMTLLDMPDLGVSRDEPGLATSLNRPLSAAEVPLWMDFQNEIFRPKAGRKKQPVGLSLTPITQEGRRLLTRVKIISPYVAERMLSWLRSFSDERLQLAAIKVANAEFDDLFTSALESADADAQSEILDWAETEA
jgi:hypothetical protein